MTLTQYISGLQLRHFAPSEVMYLGAQNGTLRLNGEPPSDLWLNIVRPIQITDMARDALGVPIRIISAFRNDDYNRAIGGASNSQHLRFGALDLSCSRNHALHQMLLAWRNAGLFKGGIGYYADSNFTHLDCRGTDATWDG